MGPTETAVQQALDQSLYNSEASLLSRAGWTEAIDNQEATRFALDLLAGITEAVKILAAAIDNLTPERQQPPDPKDRGADHKG